MEFDTFLQSLEDDAVLAFSDINMYKAGNFKDKLRLFINDTSVASSVIARLDEVGIKGLSLYQTGARQPQNQLWMTEGKKCEILKLGAHDWIKGHIKVRVIVEFEPESPELSESSLDDIRQMISE